MVPREEIEERLSRLRLRLEEDKIDGALLLQAVDVYYFSGSRQNAALWVPRTGSPVLFVKKSYSRAREESAVQDVRPFPASRDLPAFFGDKALTIGLTFDVLPVQHKQFYAGLLQDHCFADISAQNRQLRSVKSAWELEQMRTAGRLLSRAFAEVPSFLRADMREIDLAAEFEYRLRKAGIGGMLRIRGFNQEIFGIASHGPNSALPGCFDGPVSGKGLTGAAPYGPSTDTIGEGLPIILDYGGFFNGYIVDMTRIFVFGRPDTEIKRAFRVSIEIQAWLADNLVEGSICEDLFAGASRIAADAGLIENFMGVPGEQAKFVGHGVGLELDEMPVLAPKFRSPLLAGQTIAIEPKFLFPGKGAVGIENTFAVTVKGCERLTELPDAVVCL
jgi:Xaa-Pro dipeptidase